MDIVIATTAQFEEVRAFYHSLIDAMQDSGYQLSWKKDIYPAPDFLKDSITKQELYIGVSNGEIACAMVVNHDCNESYAKFEWPTKAAKDEIMVIHTFGVHPRYFGKGYARQMIHKAIQIAREHQQKALRLDVLKRNVPAATLYQSEGFRYQATVSMFYEDTGWADFKLFEYIL